MKPKPRPPPDGRGVEGGEGWPGCSLPAPITSGIQHALGPATSGSQLAAPGQQGGSGRRNLPSKARKSLLVRRQRPGPPPAPAPVREWVQRPAPPSAILQGHRPRSLSGGALHCHGSAGTQGVGGCPVSTVSSRATMDHGGAATSQGWGLVLGTLLPLP